MSIHICPMCHLDFFYGKFTKNAQNSSHVKSHRDDRMRTAKRRSHSLPTQRKVAGKRRKRWKRSSQLNEATDRVAILTTWWTVHLQQLLEKIPSNLLLPFLSNVRFSIKSHCVHVLLKLWTIRSTLPLDGFVQILHQYDCAFNQYPGKLSFPTSDG